MYALYVQYSIGLCKLYMLAYKINMNIMDSKLDKHQHNGEFQEIF